MTLTAQECSEVRHYAGYPALPAQSGDTVYCEAGFSVQTLRSRLETLASEEESTLRKYLVDLAAMERAIVAAADNLDTAQASVWVHNPQEIAQRTSLLKQWRREMCAFLGVQPGPGLGSDGIRIIRG